jgi:hypothetical protein
MGDGLKGIAHHVKLALNLHIGEQLQYHCIHTQFHWSSGPPFASRHEGSGFNPQGGYLCETGILLLALSRYIGDPDMIDHCGLV